MKKYSEYMDEVSAEELFKGLLAEGMFSDKLPPIFTSEPFYEYCLDMKHNFKDTSHDYIRFNSMRNINIPRQLGIPVPMAYARMCKGLSDNWDEIRGYFHKQTDNQKFKVSRIHIRKLKDTGKLFEMNYDNWKLDGTPDDDLILGKRFLVKADISTCFPSIYSHSIPWAFVGKEEAKNHKNKKTVYNKLDCLCQKIRDSETHGLIIGPHSSNLLSEIVLCAVDHKLVEEDYKFTRCIDDYTCYVETEEEASRFIMKLANELRYYDLELNFKKTSVERLPVVFSSQWVRKLCDKKADYRMRHKSENESFFYYSDVRSYIDNALELMKDNQDNSAILNYAIKVLSKQKMTENAKSLCGKEFFHLALIYPYLIPLLEEYVIKPYNIGTDEIESFANIAYCNGLKDGNYEESYYGIYFAWKYGFKLKEINSEDILETDNCILKLFGMLYYKSDEKELEKYKEHARKLKASYVMDRNWLFVYETLSKDDFTDEWKGLKAKNISFIKTI